MLYIVLFALAWFLGFAFFVVPCVYVAYRTVLRARASEKLRHYYLHILEESLQA
jgi:hypothetical protein